MAEGREIELKLELDPGAQSQAEALQGFGPPVTKQLLATYYDTPAGELRERGISFRVRRSGDVFVQTIKQSRGPGVGLLDRAEWEVILNDGEPDLQALTRVADGRIPAGVVSRIQPVFEVDLQRAAWQVTHQEAQIELVRDVGQVLAGTRASPVAEYELELKGGSAHHLFDMARALARTEPVRIGVLTKADRGFRLLDDADRKAAKAEPVRLDPEMSVSDAFRAIAHACLRHFRLNEPLIRERDADALHQARVALRRLRSALSLFRDVVADDRSGAIRDRLRALAAVLGEARNLDVLIDRLGDTAQPDALSKLEAEREHAYVAVSAALDSAETRMLMLHLVEWVEFGTWREVPDPQAQARRNMPLQEFAGEILDRFRTRVKKRGKGLVSLDPEGRHQLRIEAKKLRYASAFFASLFEGGKAGRRHKAFLSVLEDLQASLGALNDIATAEELAPRLAARQIRLPSSASAGGARTLLKAAEKSHDQLVSLKPFWR